MIFQDFPGPGIFKKKIQDFPGGVGTLRRYWKGEQNLGWGPVPQDVPWVQKNKLKLKPGLGDYHAIRPRSGLGLFYSSRYPHAANKPQDSSNARSNAKINTDNGWKCSPNNRKMSKVILVILSKVILLCWVKMLMLKPVTGKHSMNVYLSASDGSRLAAFATLFSFSVIHRLTSLSLQPKLVVTVAVTNHIDQAS